MSLLFRVAEYRSLNWCFRRDWIGGYWGIERVLGFQLDSNLYLVPSLFPNPSSLSLSSSIAGRCTYPFRLSYHNVALLC